MPAHALDNTQPHEGRRLVSFWAGDKEPERLEASREVQDVSESWVNVYARLQVSGVSDAECSELLGKSQAKLDVVAQSARFQALLLQYAKGSEDKAADAILKAQAMPSLVTLIQLRGAETTPVNTRVAICNSLLDRIYGKAPQVVKGSRTAPDDLGTASDDPADVARALRSKIERLTKNLGDVMPVAPTPVAEPPKQLSPKELVISQIT